MNYRVVGAKYKVIDARLIVDFPSFVAARQYIIDLFSRQHTSNLEVLINQFEQAGSHRIATVEVHVVGKPTFPSVSVGLLQTGG